MAAKSPLLRSRPAQRGQNWIAIFARLGSDDGEEPMLPRLDDAVALYQEAPGWWLPVGLAMDVPDHARGEMRRAIGEHFGFAPPAIVAPRLLDGEVRTGGADVYLIGSLTSFDRLAPRRDLA
jgi:hypothetical protein